MNRPAVGTSPRAAPIQAANQHPMVSLAAFIVITLLMLLLMW